MRLKDALNMLEDLSSRYKEEIQITVDAEKNKIVIVVDLELKDKNAKKV